MNPRVQHPDWETILAHVESGGDAAVTQHCERCTRCAGIAEALRGLLSTLERSRLPEVPPELVARALASLSDSSASVGAAATGRGPDAVLRGWLSRLGRPVREVVGSLSADSLLPSTALRGTDPASSRMLFYEAEDCRVILELSAAAPPAWALKGQVALAAGATLPADARALVAAATGLVEHPIAEDGTFALGSLPPEVDEVSLLLAERLIRLVLPG